MLKLLSRVFNTNQSTIFRTSIRCFADRYSSYKDVELVKDDIEKSFSRSSGPGGQHVNTTNSKAEIRLQPAKCYWLDDHTRQRIQQTNRLTKDGYLTITSQVHREQERNLEECYRKLQRIIYECSIVRKERRFDIPAETPELKHKRVQEKRHKSDIKKMRQSGKDDRFF